MSADKATVAAVFHYPRGKARIAPWIVDLLPPPGTYKVFVDVFGGAANVLLEVMRRNEAAGVRDVLYVYNDADEELVNFFRVMREPETRRELLELLRWTPYSRKQFRECLEMPVPENPVRRAWRFFVVAQQSYCGAARKAGHTGRWGYSVAGSDPVRDVRHWLLSQERLEAFGEAFRRVQVECLDFADILRRYGAPAALVYCDPPYYPETRLDAGIYRLELSPERHRELAELLNAFPGLAALSGYRCTEYDAWYAGWERHDRDVACCLSHVGGTRDTKGQARPRRVESLWLNPAAARARRGARQVSLMDMGVV